MLWYVNYAFQSLVSRSETKHQEVGETVRLPQAIPGVHLPSDLLHPAGPYLLIPKPLITEPPPERQALWRDSSCPNHNRCLQPENKHGFPNHCSLLGL